ncbi:peptide chain release factor 2 [Candidatus Nomurabacteria bacterium]|nr:peptide chain release factor 2 [Candidatus Nomurabacteria bacterium]
MEELKDKIKELIEKIKSALVVLDLEIKENKLQELKESMSDPDFWQNQEQARRISTEYSVLEAMINNWRDLESKIFYLESLIFDPQAEDLLSEIAEQLKEVEKKYQLLSTELYLQGKYDQNSAILTINAGAGGDDAQDWAQMLERMYLRFTESQNWQASILSRSLGSEAGIKSVTIRVVGSFVYGYLKNEAGVHRLVRLSPFDSDHARHTSFAMLEVLPELKEIALQIKEDDLKIDTYRSSGNGGQSVNTTDSAVRITHLPTGIVASCQNERSQLQNKNQAMLYLQSKLQAYFEAEKEEEKKALKGEYTSAAWGNQIRSYVLHPYKLVKDHRTNFESSDPERVLDGDLMPFIKARLEQLAK